MSQTPTVTEWVLCALERRASALQRISVCGPKCMCSPDYRGDHQPLRCQCYSSKHAMIELAKANAEFVYSVKDAIENSR